MSHHEPCSKIWFLAHIAYTPGVIEKNLWMGNIDFVSYINYHYRFGCTLAQFLGNFSWYAKCEVWGKIPR